jgi:hypothetical protein
VPGERVKMAKRAASKEDLHDYLLAEIKKVYGSQQALADKLNLTQPNISRKLKMPSKKFLRELSRAGINVPETDGDLPHLSSISSSQDNSGGPLNSMSRENNLLEMVNERIDKLFIEIGKVMSRMETLELEVKKIKPGTARKK